MVFDLLLVFMISSGGIMALLSHTFTHGANLLFVHNLNDIFICTNASMKLAGEGIEEKNID